MPGGMLFKVIWSSYWEPLIVRDTHGLLYKRMEEVVDGEYRPIKQMMEPLSGNIFLINIRN